MLGVIWLSDDTHQRGVSVHPWRDEGRMPLSRIQSNGSGVGLPSAIDSGGRQHEAAKARQIHQRIESRVGETSGTTSVSGVRRLRLRSIQMDNRENQIFQSFFKNFHYVSVVFKIPVAV